MLSKVLPCNLIDDKGCTAYAAVFDGRNYTLLPICLSLRLVMPEEWGYLVRSMVVCKICISGMLRVSGGVTQFVGGLVGYGADARYENLSVMGASLMSLEANIVGALVGQGNDAKISHSYVANSTVSGRINTGGLVGQGRDADISHSYVTETTVSSTTDSAGGLAGAGRGIRIRHSYTSDVTVVAGTADEAGSGGLAGRTALAEISYSYAIGVNVSSKGDNSLGGLLGHGDGAVIHASYAAGIVSHSSSDGGFNSGGFIGQSIVGVGVGSLDINYSYAAVETPVVPNSVNVRGFVGLGASSLTASYWNTDILIPSPDGGGAGGQTTTALQSPENPNFTGIYADWGNFWCDPNTGDEIESETKPVDDRFIRAWDLGTAEQYPALTCTPGGVARQRQRQ